MAEDMLDTMDRVLARWTVGGTAAPVADPWRSALGDDPAEAELRLLALSAQFLDSMILLPPAQEPQAAPMLPELALPAVPPAVRPLVRRLLGAGQTGLHLAGFAAARGWVLHPADWMPAPGERHAPAVYAPWQRSAATESSAAPGGADWEEMAPAERVAALTALRRSDPAAARALLESRLAAQPADARLRLLEVLGEGLSADDIPFLEGIVATDRAARTKAQATAFLARLGQGSTAGEDAAELAAFFAVRTAGLLRRRREVTVAPTKTPAQRLRRSALMDTVEIDAFAAAMGLPATELIAAWPLSEETGLSAELASMAARTGSDALCAALADAAEATAGKADRIVLALRPRLTAEHRRGLAVRMLQHGGDALFVAGELTDASPEIDAPMASAAGKDVLTALAAEDSPHSQRAAELHLLTLGRIASRSGAEDSLQRLERAGLRRSDPRLDMLNFNLALERRDAR